MKNPSKSDQLWEHWLYWLDPNPFGPDLLPLENYDPEPFRFAFERFQTHGRKGLSEEELRGIHPLIEAQKTKEITLTSLAEESMEWWAKGWGWLPPWSHTLETRKGGDKPMDEITHAAILKTVRAIHKDPLDFFMRHPGISPETKQRYLAIKCAA